MTLSIIIPTLNNLFHLQLIVGLIEQTTVIDYEIIIIDNGHDEPGVKEYLDRLPSIRVIMNKENQGVSKSWNQGVKIVKGKYIAIINNDIVIADGCFERMIETMEKQKSIWCLSPFYMRKNLVRNWARLERVQRENQQLINKGSAGFFFMFRRSIIEELSIDGKLFDEQFKMLWYEDTDFFRRLTLAGHPPQTISNVLIHHFESLTLDMIPRADRYKRENREKFYKKHSGSVK